MAFNPKFTRENEQNKFVESPSRPGKSAIEMVLTEQKINDRSIYYDGGNDHTQFGDAAHYKWDHTQDFTAAIWVKRLETATGERCPMSKQGGSNTAGWRTCHQSNQHRLHLSGGASGNRQEYRTPALNSSQSGWRFECWTYAYASGSKIGSFFIYDVNGAGFSAYENITPTQNSLNSTIDTTVGLQLNGRNGTSNTLEGILGPAYLFNVALTSAEAEELANNGKFLNDLSQFSQVGALLLHANTLAALHPNLPDSSTFGNNGAMTNFDLGQDQILTEAP